MTNPRAQRFSLKYFRVILEADVRPAQLAPKVNRQLASAVARNRIKRILREFFRGHPDFFQSGRWVFVARAQVAAASNSEVFHDLERILARDVNTAKTVDN